MIKRKDDTVLKNPELVKNDLVQWIRDYFQENGPTCTAVIGISGGKDSSIAAALCAEALGKERVLGVLMPNGVQNDIEDSYTLVNALGIPHIEINIEDSFNGLLNQLTTNAELKEITGSETPAKEAVINLAPRIRMATLYAVGQMLPNGGRVVNTCNMSEDYVGYSTKYGDAAGDFSPLSELLVEEVLQIGQCLNLPEELTFKVPSDGLSGMSDEDKLGFTYKALGQYIKTGVLEDQQAKEKIDRLHRINLHKLRLMPKYRLPKDQAERTLSNDD